jgi:AbrB family looped-hinge helix DNA binding protein
MHGSAEICIVSGLAETATVTSKSMVTIPSSIRRKYGFVEGSKVQFVELDGAVIMVPVKTLTQMHGIDKDRAKLLIGGIRELDREHRKEARR